MDKNKAHDTLHMWYGGKSESCPVCCGTCKEEDMVAEALKIAGEQFRPTVNPMVPFEKTIYMDEKGEKKEFPPADSAPDAAKKEDPKEAAPKEVSADEHKKKGTGFMNVMTDVMSFAEDKKGVPTRIKVVPVGTFKTQAYGEIEITKEKLLDMKKNYEEGVRAGGTQTGLPIDVEHGDSQYKNAAAGWMKSIYVEDDGAYADVEWTPLGKDLLESGQYKFYSPEFHFEYIDPEQSFTLDNVMTGGGLVNKPMFKHDLPPIVMNEDGTQQNLTKDNAPLTIVISNSSQTRPNDATVNQNSSLLEASEKEIKPMDLQAIIAKAKTERTSDEQAFVFTNLDQLSQEQKVAEGFVVQPVVASEEKKEEAPAVEPTPAPAPVVASENGGITAAEVTALREAAKKGEMAFAELQKSQERLQKIEITKKVEGFVFSEKGGKIAPAQVEPVVNLMLTMSESQRTELTGILEALPDRQIFGEKGSDEDLDKSKASDLLTAKAQDLMKTSKDSGTAMSFGEAMRKVVAENPDLYMESLKPASKKDL